MGDPELQVLLLSNFKEWINLLWASLALLFVLVHTPRCKSPADQSEISLKEIQVLHCTACAVSWVQLRQTEQQSQHSRVDLPMNNNAHVPQTPFPCVDHLTGPNPGLHYYNHS